MNIRDAEPPEVQEARRVIRAWGLRNGHDSYIDCLDGGHKGYQARCWNCDWEGPQYLRGDEEIDTPESRVHKVNARHDAWQHQKDTRPDPAAFREERPDA